LGYFEAIFYIDNGVFPKTYKQQQNVMLRRTGPHMPSSIARSKKKLDMIRLIGRLTACFYICLLTYLLTYLLTSTLECWVTRIHANCGVHNITDKLTCS